MALGIYIAIVVIAILAVVLLKVIQNTSKTSYFGEPSRCKKCGRKSETHECPYCRSDSKSLR
ncbi:MAG: anaerobic ribonucleoside-triphosphate reductase [Nitrosopumilus sp.]|nr:anaerobic ribonucleoside-triphosphate reductase [Nitrosopumilus sp.]